MIKRSENNIILYKRDQRCRHGTTNGSGFGEVERRKLINDNFFLLVHKKVFFFKYIFVVLGLKIIK